MSWSRRASLTVAVAIGLFALPQGAARVSAAPASSPNPAPLSATDAKLYSSAFAAASSGQWSRAHDLAAGAGTRLPAKVLHWLDMTRPGTTRDFEEIAAFHEANSDWPYSYTLRRRAEEAMTDRTPDRRVLSWFASQAPITTDGRVRLIDALFAGGQAERARALIRETWIESSFGATQERQFLAKYRGHLTAADHARRLDRLLWDGSHVQAERAVKLVDSPTRNLAMARISLRAFRSGVDWHIQQVPASLQQDFGLLYERARWRRRKGREDETYDILKDVPPTAPYAELWWTERAITARRLLEKGHVSEAYRIVAANGLTEGANFAEAEWLAGWISLRFLREPKQALEHFERIRAAVSYPISKSRAAYWAGRAANDAGDRGAATAYFVEASEHDTTYYGQLAAAMLGRNIALRTIEVRPAPDDVAAFNADERVRIVAMLNQIGAADHVRPFVDALVDNDRIVSHELTALLAMRIGRRDLAVRAARKAYLAGAALPSVAYPVMDIPGGRPEQALVHAIARQESNFDPAAVSHAGALGLMQLMPATARGVAGKLRVGYSVGKLTEEPDYNIRLGSAYLGQMLERFDGSYILAIAAYNAGPNAAARWVREYGDPRTGGADPIDWIETIPYRETRNYVQRVLENLQVYRARLGDGMLAEALVNDLRR
ncbi:MAG: lytic transglycosylase domain-containing protein [Rhodospirillaceae bacterium]